VRSVLTTLALTGVVACSPLYLPPQPSDALLPAPRFRVHGDTALEVLRSPAGLRVTLVLSEVPEPGWLAVQWFGPSGGVRASESLWLTPADADTRPSLTTPPHLELTPGEWRAVVSWDGSVVRQLRVTLP
jgi:hypothetical protein